MFSSFQQSSEQLYFQFQIPSSPFQEHHLHNHGTTIGIPTTTPSDGNLTPSQRRPGHKRSYDDLLAIDIHQDDEQKKKKKMEHREIERKRRQDMANLHSSLRSLLPLDFIKGRRSTSEHMNQAVNYIKHLQETITGLQTKRDELKKVFRITDTNLLPKTNIKSESTLGNCSRHPITVTVNSSHGGIEILIKTDSRQEGFPISKVVKTLVQEGLDVVSFNSAKVNEILIHSIQSEVSHETCIDPVSVLQQKLAELVDAAPS